uniref:Putative ovule protein n=1 Tax=Solanum chacoense TaxID=4108 RepID=A0A0V0H4N2_SOLCH
MGLQGKMEGWLCLMRLNRFGLQYSRKRYFILEDNCLKSFKFIPTSPTEVLQSYSSIKKCLCW